MGSIFLFSNWKSAWSWNLPYALESVVKRRTAHAIENSTRGKKAEVRKWMLYYDRMEIAENAVRTQHHIQFEWMRADNREIVRQLQTIEELMHEIIEEENNVYENL